MLTQAMPQAKGDRVVLHNISWQQFENILANLGERAGTRIAYLDGTLEIMSPLPEHEYFKEVIGTGIQDIAEELGIDYESYGSATWKEELKLAGVEPDNCFYIQNESLVRGRLDIDLKKQDPPPDLALEIDVTRKAIDRFPIYARIGVSEIWCFDSHAENLTIHVLNNGEYHEQNVSLCFPRLRIQELPQVIAQNRNNGRLALRRAIRRWAKAQVTAQ